MIFIMIRIIIMIIIVTIITITITITSTITITILMVKQTIQSVGTNTLNNAAILVLGYPNFTRLLSVSPSSNGHLPG